MLFICFDWWVFLGVCLGYQEAEDVWGAREVLCHSR